MQTIDESHLDGSISTTPTPEAEARRSESSSHCGGRKYGVTILIVQHHPPPDPRGGGPPQRIEQPLRRQEIWCHDMDRPLRLGHGRRYGVGYGSARDPVLRPCSLHRSPARQRHAQPPKRRHGRFDRLAARAHPVACKEPFQIGHCSARKAHLLVVPAPQRVAVEITAGDVYAADMRRSGVDDYHFAMIAAVRSPPEIGKHDRRIEPYAHAVARERPHERPRQTPRAVGVAQHPDRYPRPRLAPQQRQYGHAQPVARQYIILDMYGRPRTLHVAYHRRKCSRDGRGYLHPIALHAACRAAGRHDALDGRRQAFAWHPANAPPCEHDEHGTGQRRQQHGGHHPCRLNARIAAAHYYGSPQHRDP